MGLERVRRIVTSWPTISYVLPLGLLTWLYHRPTDGTINFLATKFASKPAIRDANITAFKAGYAFGETTEVFAVRYEVAPAPMPPGKYRQISGNLALAYGLITRPGTRKP